MEIPSDNHIAACFFPNRTDNVLEATYKPLKKSNLIVMFSVYLMPVLILFFKNCNRKKIPWNLILKLLVSLILSLVTFPALFCILFVLALYRQIISLVLKLKLGAKFGGVLVGNDAVWAVENPSARSVINVLMIVESELEPNAFYATAKKSIEEVISRNPKGFSKLLTALDKSFGYYYLINNQVTIDECVGVLELHCSEEDYLLGRLSEYANAALPKEHKALWQILIGNRTIKWKNINLESERLYPVLLRVHHGLADGASLIKVLTEEFAHTKRDILKPYSKNTDGTKFQMPKAYFKIFCTLLKASINILSQSLRSINSHDLHGQPLSGEKILVLNVEDSSTGMQLVKDLKNLPATFTELLFTSVAKSFWDYFKKYNINMPKFMIAVVPTFQKLTSNLNLENTFSVATMKLPIDAANGSFETLLEEVKSETRNLKGSGDYKVNYWFMSTVSSLLPEPLLRPLLESSQSTLVISNLPGPSALRIFDDCAIHDIVFWVPHKNLTGIGISVFSYDERLQIGLSVDKALISNPVQAQEIVDGIYKYLRRWSSI